MKLFFFRRNQIMKQSNLTPIGVPVLNQKALFLGKGKIKFGKNVNIGYFPSAEFFSTYAHIEARNISSYIFIDDDTYINNNCNIVSDGGSIHIGKNCRIGINFTCFDSDFHGLTIKDRDNSETIVRKDVYIGDNVFIGNNVMILKGVTIGSGAVIAAGSVVTNDIPQNTIGGGNPCKILRKIEN